MRRWGERVRDIVPSGYDIAALTGIPTFEDGVACDRVLAAIRSAGRGEGAR